MKGKEEHMKGSVNGRKNLRDEDHRSVALMDSRSI